MSHAQDIARMKELAEILEIPILTHKITNRVYTLKKEPRTLDELREIYENEEPKFQISFQGHSWTRNMYNYAIVTYGGGCYTGSNAFGDGHVTLKRTSGSNAYVNLYAGRPGIEDIYQQTAWGNDTTHGIWVGSGSTAESFEDYTLDTQIDHGSAAGLIRYWDMYEPVRTWSVGDRKWTLDHHRCFTNHSGGTLTINEVGLVASIRYYDENVISSMVARDIVSPGVEIEDSEMLRVDYTLETSAWPS